MLISRYVNMRLLQSTDYRVFLMRCKTAYWNFFIKTLKSQGNGAETAKSIRVSLITHPVLCLAAGREGETDPTASAPPPPPLLLGIICRAKTWFFLPAEASAPPAAADQMRDRFLAEYISRLADW